MSTHKRSPWAIFTIVAIAQFMVVLDVSITNIALPRIAADLHFMSESSLQWVITAYALAFGGFLLLGGRAADLYGRRLTLMSGIAAFTLFSFLIGIAPSAVALIVLRSAQGLAAAFMSPAALSIVLSNFTEGDMRNQALAYWSVISTIGAAAGLILGGALTQYLGWRWDFFVNVPVGIAVFLLLPRFVPAREHEESNTALDIPGAVLVTGGLISLVYALSRASVVGWLSLETLGTIALAAVLIAAFLWNESRVRHPLMPLSIFRIRNLTGGNLMMVPLVASMFGMFFLLSLYMQEVLHYGPLQSGISFLPFPFILGVVAARMPKLVRTWGFRPFLILGPILAGLGILWLTRLPVDGNYFFDLLPSYVLISLGLGVSFMPIFATATSGVPLHESGLASGILNTSQQMGGALGLAILSSVATYFAQSGGSSVQATISGLHHAFLTSAIFTLLALGCALFVLRPARARHGAAAAALH